MRLPLPLGLSVYHAVLFADTDIIRLIDGIRNSYIQREIMALVYTGVYTLFLMTTSLYILYLIRFSFRSTYEKQIDTFRLFYILPVIFVATIPSYSDFALAIRYRYHFNVWVPMIFDVTSSDST
jgi:hypothetical protein